ncbi:MAG: hypothetical protein IKH19_09770 [Muribaculaceae bacterium]|nr:hypothetical protein [Muribaculaceae bacterium]
MKKFTLLFAIAALMMGSTSCLKDDANNERTIRPTFLTRSIDTRVNTTEGTTLGTSASTIVMDLNKNTITISMTAKISESNTVTFQTPAMPYTRSGGTDNGYTLVFGAASASAGNYTITDVKGAYDQNGSIMLSCTVNSSYKLVCMNAPVYSYLTMTCEDFITSSSAAVVAINLSDSKAILGISPFQTEKNGNIIQEFILKDLTFATTMAGYKASADEVIPTDDTGQSLSENKATNIVVNMENMGATMTADFDYGGHTVHLAGKMFNNGFVPF